LEWLPVPWLRGPELIAIYEHFHSNTIDVPLVLPQVAPWKLSLSDSDPDSLTTFTDSGADLVSYETNVDSVIPTALGIDRLTWFPSSWWAKAHHPRLTVLASTKTWIPTPAFAWGRLCVGMTGAGCHKSTLRATGITEAGPDWFGGVRNAIIGLVFGLILLPGSLGGFGCDVVSLSTKL
jgi:hypothetical protein